MSSRRHEYDDAIVAEVALWPGATVELSKSAKHRLAILSFAGKTRKAFYPGTPGDKRGCLNMLTGLRHELRGMGAVRTEVAKSHAEHAHRKTQNRVATVRPSAAPVVREDRFMSRLAELKERMG